MVHQQAGDPTFHDAFISYSRKDRPFAVLFQRALNSYTPPSGLPVARRPCLHARLLGTGARLSRAPVRVGGRLAAACGGDATRSGSCICKGGTRYPAEMSSMSVVWNASWPSIVFPDEDILRRNRAVLVFLELAASPRTR